MKKTIGEKQLRNLIRESVRNILINEAFDDANTRDIIAAHGGIDNVSDELNMPLDKLHAEEENVVSKEIFNSLPFQLQANLLKTGMMLKDGSYLYIDEPFDFDLKDASDYDQKVGERNRNAMVDYYSGEGNIPGAHKDEHMADWAGKKNAFDSDVNKDSMFQSTRKKYNK